MVVLHYLLSLAINRNSVKLWEIFVKTNRNLFVGKIK